MISLFVLLALLRRTSFLTTFYSLYFSHHYTYYKLQSFACCTSVFCLSTICQIAENILELYIPIHIWKNQLLIFIEKFSSLPGFEPQTSWEPRWCATNRAMQAWMTITNHVSIEQFWFLFQLKHVCEKWLEETFPVRMAIRK